jgi:predicted Mrr-cat superfamily restriction endonuclease
MAQERRMSDTKEAKALILRVSPEGENLLGQCLEQDRIAIGWPGLEGLLDAALDWREFREAIHKKYHPTESNLRKAGAAGGHLWRFIRALTPGDYVVVPAPAGEFYLAQVTGEARLGDAPNIGFWRPVKWLNEKQPIPRRMAGANLQSRMKVYGTTATADDLVPAIESVLEDAEGVRAGRPIPKFEDDLRRDLLEVTLKNLREGRLDSYKFEHVVHRVLQNLGAQESLITPRSKDKGDDIVATVTPLGLFELKLVVQVKHYNQLEPPLGPHVVKELTNGMNQHDADLGLIVTVGVIGEDTKELVRALVDEGERITLVDGLELAELYLDHCAIP